MTPSVEWIEVLDLKPHEYECRACCLEPDEVMFLKVAATGPIDATLIGWEAYQHWLINGEGGMPLGTRFANGTRSIEWHGESPEPPYIEVLLVFNPGNYGISVTVEARIPTLRTPAAPSPAPSRDETGEKEPVYR